MRAPPQAPVQVVWFKRDLRVHDHAPLVEAAARGPVLCLYVLEPEALERDDFDPIHLGFALECLADLERALGARGGALVVRVGRLPEVLESLWRERPFRTLWSHEETGPRWTFARDRRVARWARARGVEWAERPQSGVVRGPRAGVGREVTRRARSSTPALAPPMHLEPAAGFVPGRIPTAAELEVAPERAPGRARGGESGARARLDEVVARLVEGDLAPDPAADDGGACLRLSAPLAFGALSLRTVAQALDRAAERVRGTPAEAARTRRLAAVATARRRLRCRDRCAQALEDAPRLEFESAVRDAPGRAERVFDDERFAAWAEGRTGFPRVDAAMRALATTGWIDVRARARLVAFATGPLRLAWRPVGLHLARRFLDYDAAVHWVQVQTQAGATRARPYAVGSPIAAPRPDAVEDAFVRRHVPELAQVPPEALLAPWRLRGAALGPAGGRLGRDYPAPIVVVGAARGRAGARITRTSRAASAAGRASLAPPARGRPA